MIDNVFSETTRSITVSVRPTFLPNQSYPYEDHYTWAYSVTLENNSDETVQLLNRYWHITDGNGVVKEVKGPGVVGEQPILRPGDSFQYTSGTLLPTTTGIMMGNYEMVTDDKERFEIKIPPFSLDSPEQLAKPN